MRLAEFIRNNIETILGEWEDFARSIWPRTEASPSELRDHAAEMLRAVAADMESSQTSSQQFDKSRGLGPADAAEGETVDAMSNLHALSRHSSGFELRELVAEYRALRASVIKQWSSDRTDPSSHDIDDIVRFNESIDQLLAASVTGFVASVEASRECFLGILGHDLRSPLSAATLAAYVLAESNSLDERSSHLASSLQSSLTAMDHLVRDLIDFTGNRLGAKMAIRRRRMDMIALCREVVDELRIARPAQGFVCESLDGNAICGDWDGGRLRQMISNLVGNAVQHGIATKPITLKASVDGGEARLSVHNWGPTIAQKAIPTIFDPLKRLQPSETSPQGSLGLGLYIAREVAVAHGGTIRVSSERGETEFTVCIPGVIPPH